MVNLAQLQVQYVTTETGEKTAVILAINDFEELLEDLEDLAIVAERRAESTISHEQLLAELQQDGLLSH